MVYYIKSFEQQKNSIMSEHQHNTSSRTSMKEVMRENMAQQSVTEERSARNEEQCIWFGSKWMNAISEWNFCVRPHRFYNNVFRIDGRYRSLSKQPCNIMKIINQLFKKTKTKKKHNEEL